MTNLAKYGFSLIRERRLEEIDSNLYEIEHNKSGARLIYLDREEENKTFCIGFPTPPSDDTGVFHIIEHSVLCGSEKYPLRDPFAELLKGSLNTFLNAMTYEDRTIYPISSRCEKDFLNLTDVYLDAVFSPNLLRDQRIFMQEGWHYEYDEESRALTLNGVVYNEMKGAYSSPDELSAVALNRALWSEEIYRYDSGGDPEHIPELTYEKFKSAYEKYYHPSSAKIILDGRMDLTKVLPLIDSHLSKFDRKTPTVLPKERKPVIAPDLTISYEIPENESEDGKARLTYGFVYSDFSDKEAQLCVSILADILCGSNASPLKRALLDRGLAKDAIMYSIKSRRQTVVIEIRDAGADKIDEIDASVKEVINRLVEGGIEKSRLISTLNSIEFRLRERDFGTMPSGIAFATSIYSNWIYGGNPEDGLVIDDTLKSIRERIQTNYFEEELRKIFLENNHKARVIMLPDKELGAKNAKAEAERLKKILDNMREDELSAIIEADRELKIWQQSDESDEALATIPTLTLEDIPKNINRPTYSINEQNGVKILKCDAKTNGIVYISMYFDASDLASEDLIKLSLLCAALINSPTANHDALALQNDIKSNIGNFYPSFAIGCKDGVTTPYFKLFASSLTTKIDDLIRITKEVLTTSRIEDEDEIYNLILQMKSHIEDAMISSGESFAMSRVEAGLTEVGAITEYLSGYEAYKILSRLADDKEKVKELINSLGSLLGRLMDRQRLTLSVTGEISDDEIGRLIEIITDTGANIERRQTPICAAKSEFIVTPSKVGYAAMGGHSKKVGEHLGALRVVRSILSYEYLWNTIRVKNGAYGAGFVVRRDGGMEFYSYRDPSPHNSIKYYKQSADYLRHIASEGDDITKFIIGAIGEYDFIITPKIAANLITRDYLNGYNAHEEIKIREDMLKMNAEDLILAADIIDEVLHSANTVIVGGPEQLEALDAKPERIIKI